MSAYEPGTLYDEESFRSAMSRSEFERYDRMLRDEWAARVYFANKRMEKAARCRQQIQYAANDGLGGMMPTLQLDRTAVAWLNLTYPGWQECDEFARDLMRHHPETKVKVAKRENRVGWTSALKGAESVPVLPKAAPRKAPLVALTDKRGNAA